MIVWLLSALIGNHVDISITMVLLCFTGCCGPPWSSRIVGRDAWRSSSVTQVAVLLELYSARPFGNRFRMDNRRSPTRLLWKSASDMWLVVEVTSQQL